jgi:hypothetical protein
VDLAKFLFSGNCESSIYFIECSSIYIMIPCWFDHWYGNHILQLLDYIIELMGIFHSQIIVCRNLSLAWDYYVFFLQGIVGIPYFGSILPQSSTHNVILATPTFCEK